MSLDAFFFSLLFLVIYLILFFSMAPSPEADFFGLPVLMASSAGSPLLTGVDVDAAELVGAAPSGGARSDCPRELARWRTRLMDGRRGKWLIW